MREAAILVALLAVLECSATSVFLDPYEFSSNSFVPLDRVKRSNARFRREDDPNDDTVDRVWEPVDEVHNATTEHYSEHTYYNMSITGNNPDEVAKHWVDVEKMLKDGAVGNSSHPLLSNSYRRAVSARITFDFPFYGHKMNNLTIATGGFSYIGDQTHSWLAATQYIAPLMANFDTNLPNSSILYADDGKKFVVEWRKVQLRQQRSQGPFTFQAILHKNGDMVFVYKDVPMNISNISDAHHPCKLGVSDAYLFQHAGLSAGFTASSKRVIYEYHRIEIPPSKVTSNTVVVLTAEQTCMSLETCSECANVTLRNFNCSWCHAKKKHGGPFCTDVAGLHRKRQHWIEGNCKDQQKNIYCSSEQDDQEVEDDDETSSSSSSSSAAPAKPTSPSTPEKPLPNPKKDSAASKMPDDGASGGSTALLVLFGVSATFIGWLAYAYYNPHTTSGQLLIRYRPSRWHVPNSHVRYSASVHM